MMNETQKDDNKVKKHFKMIIDEGYLFVIDMFYLFYAGLHSSN